MIFQKWLKPHAEVKRLQRELAEIEFCYDQCYQLMKELEVDNARLREKLFQT